VTRALRQEVDAAGVLRVTLDVPGAAVNTLSPALIDEFDALLGQLEAGPASTRAVVLASAKRDNFVAGADIKQFEQLGSAAEGEALSRTAQALLDRLEALRLPVVAAVHGSCLGGGLELALACRCRIASSDPKTTLGAPEVMLGLIPGAGGTQRLPRLVGLVRSLDLILTGRSLRPAAAHRAGLVDRVVPAAALLEEAHRVALALAEGRPWLSRGGLRLAERLLRGWILRRARGRVRKRTGAHYPAPFRAIEVVGEGLARGQAAGLRLEAKRFGELAASDVSQALVSIFLASQAIKKDSGVPADTAVRETRRLGVLGAGLMGAGISAAAARAGVAVRLKDTGAEALGRGLRHVRGVFEQRRRRGRLSRRELEQYMDRVAPTVQMTGFGRADVIIEAVFEDLDLKRRVLAETEEVVSEECVLASNTSSLPIAEIARDAQRPSRVLGMHFFSPVEKMPLLEIVVTPATDATATATAVALGRRLGKHVIVVRDGPGFYTTRTLAAYLNEAGRLLEDGGAGGQRDDSLRFSGWAPDAARRGRHRCGREGGHGLACQAWRTHGSAGVHAAGGRGWAAGTQEQTRLLQLRRATQAGGRVRLRCRSRGGAPPLDEGGGAARTPGPGLPERGRLLSPGRHLALGARRRRGSGVRSGLSAVSGGTVS